MRAAAILLAISIAGLMALRSCDTARRGPAPEPPPPYSAPRAPLTPAVRLDIPSDPKATYAILGNTPVDTQRRILTTRRTGPSGASVAIRLIDCANRTYGYIGNADTLGAAQTMARKKTVNSFKGLKMSGLFEGSISWYAVQAACRGDGE